MKQLIFLLLLLSYTFLTNAQDTKWGKVSFERIMEGDTKIFKVGLSFMNDYLYIRPGEKETDFIVGNGQLQVMYSQVQKGKLHLTKLIKGTEYLTQFNIDGQSKYGFKFEANTEGLYILLEKFVLLTHQHYHPSKYFKPGPNEDQTLITYLELLGGGNAYFGQHNQKGEFEGTGTYVKANKDKYSGKWKDDAQNGRFEIIREREFRAEGHFVNGVQDGIWKYVNADDSYVEQVFANGKKQSEEKKFKAQKDGLKTGLKTGKIYKSVYTEELKNGVWKKGWAYEKYFIYDFENYHSIKYKDSFDKIIKHKARLVSVTDDDSKRVETYDYTFQKGYGHSEVTITIFKTPQKTPDGKENYDISFHFPHKKGDFRYYIQHENERDKLARENMKKMKELQKEIGDILENEKKKEEKKKQQEKQNN